MKKCLFFMSIAVFLVFITGCEETEQLTPITDPPVEENTLILGSGPELDPSIFPSIGSKEFLTANENEELSSGLSQNRNNNGYNSHGALSDDDGDMDFGVADPNSPPSTEAEAEPDPNREIVEADIVKMDGDILYILNRFRGLVVIDLSVPDEPEVIGRLPFKAIPIEMYVRDGRAYIVISDYFTYWMYDPDADPMGFHGSAVLIADVSEPSDPYLMGSLALDGEVTDTRMVGDVLYSVSKRNPTYWRYNTVDWEDTTWIVSLNIADPDDIREIDRITFNGTSTLIHVAHHAIFVAATDPNYYLYDAEHKQETLVTYVDISEPNGELRQRGRIYIPGRIADKFKMNWHDGAFRVFSYGWNDNSRISLYVVDTSYPDELEMLGILDLDSGNWRSMRASRFDGDRAYVMSYHYQNQSNWNQLNSIDISDQANPQLADSMRIDITISHFETFGDRLIAIGQTHDYHDRRVTIALYDVEDLSSISLIEDVNLGNQYSSSEAISDYKAFKIMRDLGMILVPLSWWDSPARVHHSGTQIVDWYEDSLTERGFIDNTGGVKRAFPLENRLIAVGERQVQVIDANDRDEPIITAEVYLIKVVMDIFDVQGLEVQMVVDAESNKPHFDVIEFGPEDNPEVLATLELPFSYTPITYRDGDMFHMIGWEPDRGQVIHTADFTNPEQPRLRGTLAFSDEFDRIYNQGYSFYYYYWSPYAGLPLENSLLPVTMRELVEDETGRRDYESSLRLVDMSDPDNPRVTDANIPMNDYPFINKVTHGDMLWSTHVEQSKTDTGESLLYHVRSYVDRIDVTDPDNPVELPSMNIPGWLIDVDETGTIMYTIDYQWDDFGRRRNSLNILKIVGDEAILTDMLPVSDQVNRGMFRDRTIWLTTHKYPWWGVRSDTLSSRQPYTELTKLNVENNGTINGFATSTLQGYHFDLLDVEDNFVIMASRFPYGLILADASNPSEAEIVNSSRTIGYVSRIVRHEGFMYMPLKWYGVHRTEAR